MQQEPDDTPGAQEARKSEPPPPYADETTAEAAFIRGVLARGEAAKAINGKLPPGALYEIVDEPPGRLPKLIRRRIAG